MSDNGLILVALGAVFGSVIAIGILVARVTSGQYSSYEDRAVRAIGEQLNQVHLFMDPERFFQITMLVVVACFLLGFSLARGEILSGCVLGAGFAAIGFVVPRVYLQIAIRKRMIKLNEQLPDGLEMLSSSLRAGMTLSQALSRAAAKCPAPLSQELGVILQEVRLGTSLPDALKHWSDRVQVLDVRLVVGASEIALRLGGNLAETYENLSRLIRERFMFQREVKAMTAEGNMQAVFMALLPFALLIFLSIINPSTMVPFIQSKIGMCAIGLVVVLTLAGFFWIKKIVTIDF